MIFSIGDLIKFGGMCFAAGMLFEIFLVVIYAYLTTKEKVD